MRPALPAIHHPTWATALAAVVVLTFAPAPIAAAGNDSDTGPAAEAQPSGPRRDFFFARPLGSIGVRGSWVFARAGSDLFDFVEDQLTVEKGDFNAPAFAADLGLALTPRADAVFGFQLSRASIRSEYRHLVDNDRLPIEQTTMLKAFDLSGSLRYALRPRGHEVSRLAWVPSRVCPYVGAGAGAMWYEFKQSGDFVDFVDLAVFSDTFRSAGWTPSAHVFGGVDLRLYRHLFVSSEGRYVWADAKLGRDFIDFEPIDLAGFRLSTGITLMF